MTVTARDVAKKAGVSPAAASLVFRGKPGVGDATRDHVLAVAREMGFESRSQRERGRTSTLQLIIYKRHGKVVSETPFFEQLTKGVSTRRTGSATTGYPSRTSTPQSTHQSSSRACEAPSARESSSSPPRCGPPTSPSSSGLGYPSCFSTGGFPQRETTRS